MGIKNWIMGIATLTTMTGTVKAEPKPVPDSIKTEVVTTDYSQELKSLDEALKNSANLQHNDLCEISDWSRRIIQNPSDPVSREAFKRIKAEALKITNIFVMANHYYNYKYLDGLNLDNLVKSQKQLHLVMDGMLADDGVRNNIPEANIKIHVHKEAEDLATMRYYEQVLNERCLQQKPEKLNAYHEALRGNKKTKNIAKNMEMIFYKEYGLDISPEFNYWEGDGNDRRYMESLFLNDKILKEKVYMLCLHASLDGAFSYKPVICSNVVYQGKKYSIPNTVAISFNNYSVVYALRERGKKLTKEQEKILDTTPSEVRSATDAYLKKIFDQFCKEMDKPEGEEIKCTDTFGQEIIEWSNYIKLERKENLTYYEQQQKEGYERSYPLMVKASEYYKIHKLLSESENKNNNNNNNNKTLAENMTISQSR